jgi:hypothetical protein
MSATIAPRGRGRLGARPLTASRPRWPLDRCRALGNHVLVVFGATGDLARRKLLPGLFPC